jgi:hypothetical protein
MILSIDSCRKIKIDVFAGETEAEAVRAVF